MRKSTTYVLSLEKLREIDPNLLEISDDELVKIKNKFYELGRLIFDDWLENGGGSKYPTRVLQKFKESNKIKS